MCLRCRFHARTDDVQYPLAPTTPIHWIISLKTILESSSCFAPATLSLCLSVTQTPSCIGMGTLLR